MASRLIRFTLCFSCIVIISSQLSDRDVVASVDANVNTATRRHFQSDCVHFIGSRDLRVTRQIVLTQRRLADDGIQSAVIDIDNYNNRLLTSCNRPIYTIIGDEEAKGRLKTFSSSYGDDRLSGRIWLLFLREGSSNDLDGYFLDIDIPFDCEFVVAIPPDSDGNVGLIEVYRVAKHLPLQKFNLGSSNKEEGATFSNTGFYNRRSDLNGITLSADINTWAPLSYYEIDPSDNRTVIHGFSAHYLKIFQSQMNYTSVQVVPKDKSWGILMENGSWDGIIRDILLNQVNMSGVPIIMTPDRLKAVSFSTPLINEIIRVHIRQPSRTISLRGLISPFSPNLWWALLFTSLTLSGILALLYKMEAPFRDTAFQVFTTIFCQQGSTETSAASSKRLLVLLVYFLGTITLTSYSCFFIASLTNDVAKLPFTDLQGLLDDGSYSLGMVKGAYVHGAFKLARNNLLQKLYDVHISKDSENLVLTQEEGFKRVCKKKFAFIVSEYPELSSKASCKITTLPGYFAKLHSGLVFPKNSAYVGIFNDKLLRLKSSGIFKKHLDDAYRQTSPSENNNQLTANLEDVIPIFTLAAAGLLLSILILLFEKILVGYWTRHVFSVGRDNRIQNCRSVVDRMELVSMRLQPRKKKK